MKKIVYHISSIWMVLLIIATLLLSACSQNDHIEDSIEEEVPNIAEWTFPDKVKVNAPNSEKSRVAYEDNGSVGVKQIWEKGDQFILYNSIGENALYNISNISTDASNAEFILDPNYKSLTGEVFYAVYNNNVKALFTQGAPTYSLNVMGQTQSGIDNNALAHLEQYDLIATNSITEIDQDLVFISRGALLTFSFDEVNKDLGVPKTLTIETIGGPMYAFKSDYSDSEPTLSSYTLNFSGYTTDILAKKAYIMLPPFTLASNSKLAITLKNEDNKEFIYTGKFSKDKPFEAATRYSFPISDLKIVDTYTDEMDQLNAYWDDGWGTKYKPAVGDGSQDNPYILSTAWNVAWMKACLKLYSSTHNNPDVYYKLDTSINIKESVDWREIGDASMSFKANFDGNGNEINGLSILAQNSHDGLFGWTEGATISNLTVSGSISSEGYGGSYFGGIVGMANNTTISNCDNYVSVSNPNGGSVGGIVGQGQGLIVIENCNNYATIDGFGGVGGIIGVSNNTQEGSKIVNCNNYAVINCGHREGGGIMGEDNTAKLTITNCLNAGDVIGGNNDGNGNFGGIAGTAFATNITYCTNQGHITGRYGVGTIIGNSSGGTLSNTNTNTGTANGEQNKPIGNQ